MASSGPTKEDPLGDLVRKFVDDCAEIGSPVYLIAAGYVQQPTGEAFYRTRVDGQSDEVIGALCALISMITPLDFQRLEVEMKNHPGFAMFRAANRQPASTKVH